LRSDQDVVLFTHPYSSICSSEAVENLDKALRHGAGKKGRRPPHLLLRFCPLRISWHRSTIQTFHGWTLRTIRWPSTPLTPEKILCSDLDEAAQKRRVEELKTFSFKRTYSKPTYFGWRDIPNTYFYCLQDQAIPIAAQKGMVEGLRAQFRTET
jgi:hypothetical protein